jgi:hypothetical protein
LFGSAARILEFALATFREFIPIAPALRQALPERLLLAAKSP